MFSILYPCLWVHLIELNDTINRCGDIGQNFWSSFLQLHLQWKFILLLVHTFEMLLDAVLVLGTIVAQTTFVQSRQTAFQSFVPSQRILCFIWPSAFWTIEHWRRWTKYQWIPKPCRCQYYGCCVRACVDKWVRGWIDEWVHGWLRVYAFVCAHMDRKEREERKKNRKSNELTFNYFMIRIFFTSIYFI